MDWNAAIDINREALKRILALLVAMVGFGEAPSLRDEVHTRGAMRTIPRHLHRAALRLLRPAEAAARRLIIVAARDIAVAPAPGRPRKAKADLLFVRNGIGTGVVLPSGVAHPGAPVAGPAAAARSLGFALFDPVRTPSRRRRLKSSGVPRVWASGCGNPIQIPDRNPTTPDDPVGAARLDLRLAALARALDDLPKQALRFARWRGRIAFGQGEGLRNTSRFHRLRPLRPGRPPGSLSRNSRRLAHEVHEILARAHGLAFWVLEHRDTS